MGPERSRRGTLSGRKLPERRVACRESGRVRAAFSLLLTAAVAAYAAAAQAAPCNSLPDVSMRIGRAQLFLYNPNDYAKLAGARDVLGINSDVHGQPHRLPASMWSGMYITVDRWGINGHKDPERDLAWFQRYHPSWIAYKADQRTPAWEFGDRNYVPLDISNPAVRAFTVSTEIAPYLTNIYSGVSVDNVTPTNVWGRVGVCSIAFTSGTCSDNGGKWRRLYGGQRIDSRYLNDYIAWLKYLKSWLATSPAPCLLINLSYRPDDRTGDAALAHVADAITDETGFVENCRIDPIGQNWVDKVKFYADLSVPLVVNNYIVEPGSPPCATATSLPQNLWNWVFASYLMEKTGRTYLAWSVSSATTSGNKEFQDFRPELYAQIGLPQGGMMQSSGGAYFRKFTSALALVNPWPTRTVSYELGSEIYHDAVKTNFVGHVSLPPLTAKFLFIGAAPGSH